MIKEYPIVDELGNIFKIIQGHQITDEEIYNNYGEYPIFTGPNTIKGYWNKTIIKQDELPCLTYATKAFDGTITIQDKLFDANNTAVLIVKEKYKEKILLKWFKYKLPAIFFNVMTSKEGVSYLNKQIVEKIEIEIPDINQQKKQIKYYEDLYSKYYTLEYYLEQLLKLREKIFETNYKEYQAQNIEVNKCIDYLSGTSGLTEEKNYLRLNNDGENFKLLTGSLNINNNQIVKIKNNEAIPKFVDKEGLLVVRKGKAGRTKYLEPGKYTLNDDAYILFKLDNTYDINLRWFEIQYKQDILSYASSSDNGTWNMTGFFRNVKIDIPSINEQDKIVKVYEILNNMIDKIELIKEKYLELSKREIVE